MSSLEDTILCSMASIQSYKQQNKLDFSSNIHPIPITNKKKTASWLSYDSSLGLLDVIKFKLKTNDIRIMEFNASIAPEVTGVCIEQKNTSIIYVKNSLNFCYKRFIVAKELSHLLINDSHPKYRITPTKQDFKDLLDSVLLNNAKTKPQESEINAYYGAMELLIPKDYAQSSFFQDNDSTTIAEKIKCPTQVIELRKKPEIINIFNKLYQQPSTEYAQIIDTINRTQ